MRSRSSPEEAFGAWGGRFAKNVRDEGEMGASAHGSWAWARRANFRMMDLSMEICRKDGGRSESRVATALELMANGSLSL